MALFPWLAALAALGLANAAGDPQEPIAQTIYGPDDRIDLYETDDARLLALADSTVALFRTSEIQLDGHGAARLSVGRFGDALQLCPGERFRDQPIGAFCSGFLVGPDLIATAGHCVSDDSCESTRFVFGYSLRRKESDPSTVPASEVYRCRRVLGREYDEAGADWALLRIDRAAAGHAPLAMRTSGAINKGEPVLAIGHPSGLPTKIAGSATVRDASKDAFFTANLDTFGGNSGSAVFNARTGLVEGVLARGEEDFVWNDQAGCRVSRLCRDDGCKGEDVSRITLVKPSPLAAKKPGAAFTQLLGSFRN